MEISDIKNRLTINQVLNHYGLKPDKNKRINCPFHNDKTPSMQVYPETNTVFCFSSNCKLNGKAIDQIDFIMHKESCTKHEAINKARILSGEYPKSKTITINKNMIEKPENAGRIAVLTKLMYEAKESLIRSAKAQEYCKQRGLANTKIEVGFLADRFYHSWNEQLKQSAIEAGLLKENANNTLSPVFKNCLLFAVNP